jgi:hypothetical protein
MPDITMCKGEGCPIKEHCYRHTAEADDYQSFLVESPWDGKTCKLFWGPQSKLIMDQLIKIVNNESTSDNSDNGLHGI